MKTRGVSRIPHRRGHLYSGGATIQFCQIFQNKTSTVGYHETFSKSMSTKRAMLFTTALLKSNTLFKRIKTHYWSYCTVCFHCNIQFHNLHSNYQNPSNRNHKSNCLLEYHRHTHTWSIIRHMIDLCRAEKNNAYPCFSDVVFKITLIGLSFSFKKLKIPVIENVSQEIYLLFSV